MHTPAVTDSGSSSFDAPHPALPFHRKIIHFSGRVQGVGFRYTARNIAQQYDVRGYVRNLPDGRVELVVEGCDLQADRMIAEIRRKMSMFVRACTTQTAPPTGEFDQFAIRH